MSSKEFDGKALASYLSMVPGGAPRMDALKNAIGLADEAGDAYYGLFWRYDYACEATFRDDATKAMPVAAEFAQMFEEYPNALPKDGGAEAYLMITQMGIDPVAYLPQIPIEQWEQMMEQFHALVKRFHIGMRTYWWQMARFWTYIDKKKAFEYFEKFWKTGRDGLSDCRACERSNAVRMCLLIGDRAAADEYAKPLKAGKFQFCSDTPHLYLLAYLEDALDRGDLDEARPLANQLSRKGNRDKSDLSYVGAVLRCFAYSDLDRAIERLTSRLEWTFGMWDKKKVYDFYKGAWVCFRELSKRQDTISLDLPKEFAMYQADGTYDCAALEQWFHDQAEDIAGQFDKRNGSDFFARDMAAACACEKGQA